MISDTSTQGRNASCFTVTDEMDVPKPKLKTWKISHFKWWPHNSS